MKGEAFAQYKEKRRSLSVPGSTENPGCIPATEPGPIPASRTQKRAEFVRQLRCPKSGYGPFPTLCPGPVLQAEPRP
jgi:hypothetical protein